MTRQQQITKFLVKDLKTIIDTLQWSETWPLNGSSRIRAQQKLLRKHKGACKSSWSRLGSLKSYTMTIPWNLAKLVKMFRGIIVRRHHENCGPIPWNAIAICEMFKTSWQMGKLLVKGHSENHFVRPSDLLVGAVVEYRPISAKDLSRLHQFGKKVLPDIFLGYVLYAV